MSDQKNKDPRPFWVPREAIIALGEAPATASEIAAETDDKIVAEINAKIDDVIVTYHSDLTRLLGGGPRAGRYLDAVAFWIERQLFMNKFDDSTPAENKTELTKIAQRAGELSSLLMSMSLDTALTLRIALRRTTFLRRSATV